MKTTVDAQGRRMAFAFVFGRSEPLDQADWAWGGVMALPRELSPADDGSLKMRPPAELEGLRLRPLDLSLEPSRPTAGAWSFDGGTFLGRRATMAGEWSFVLLGDHPTSCEFEVDLRLATSGRGGALIGVDERMTEGYAVEIDAGRHLLTLKRLRSTHNTASLLLQQVALPLRTNGDARYRLRCFLDVDLLEVFVDDDTALSARVYAAPGGVRRLGLCFSGPQAEFSGLSSYAVGLEPKTGSV